MYDINSIDTQQQSVTATGLRERPALRRHSGARLSTTRARSGTATTPSTRSAKRSASSQKARHRTASSSPTSARACSGASSTASTPRCGASTVASTGSRPEIRELQRAQDGTEINARELEMTTHRAQNLGDRRDAFEQMRDAAAAQYRTETGDVWRPRYGSNVSQTGKLTSASIDARDFMRARKDRETRAHLPEGTLVAVAGGKQVANPDAVIARLDKAKEKYADLILVHGGGPGIERIAAQWAERNGVHQVVCKPDWNAHGRAAPFRRNDELLNLLPKGVIAFPGSGITDNLVDKAVKLGIPVQRCAA